MQSVIRENKCSVNESSCRKLFNSGSNQTQQKWSQNEPCGEDGNEWLFMNLMWLETQSTACWVIEHGSSADTLVVRDYVRIEILCNGLAVSQDVESHLRSAETQVQPQSSPRWIQSGQLGTRSCFAEMTSVYLACYYYNLLHLIITYFQRLVPQSHLAPRRQGIESHTAQ